MPPGPGGPQQSMEILSKGYSVLAQCLGMGWMGCSSYEPSPCPSRGPFWAKPVALLTVFLLKISVTQGAAWPRWAPTEHGDSFQRLLSPCPMPGHGLDGMQQLPTRTMNQPWTVVGQARCSFGGLLLAENQLGPGCRLALVSPNRAWRIFPKVTQSLPNA